jgi:pilus assembly protein CpaD
MFPGPARAALPLAAAALWLCACATPQGDEPPAKAAAVPTAQYALEATGRPDEIRLDPHLEGLSHAQLAAVAELAARWRESGGGVLTIQAPLGGADVGAALHAADEARLVLLRLGAPAERVRQIGYQPAAGQPAAVIVGFEAHEAVVARCGQHWENLAATTQNRPMDNFGCAVTANMAAQIANPGDIVEPRASDPADAGRRSYVLDQYRKGSGTAGASTSQASGAISSAGGGSGGSSGGSGGGSGN